MQSVIIRKYSTFFDAVTNTQFNPVLDVTEGLYIGAAQVDESLTAHFAANPAYQLVSDAQYESITTGKPEVDTPAFGQAFRDDFNTLYAEINKPSAAGTK